jgi:hypothetical protein
MSSFGPPRWLGLRADAVAAHLDRARLQWRVRAFKRDVASALADLGLEQRDLAPHARALVREVCSLGHAEQGANPCALALEFFLRLTIEYPKLVDPRRSRQGLLIRGIRTLRSWRLVGRLDAARTEAGIERIRRALLENLDELDISSEDRLEVLAHVLDL